MGVVCISLPLSSHVRSCLVNSWSSALDWYQYCSVWGIGAEGVGHEVGTTVGGQVAGVRAGMDTGVRAADDEVVRGVGGTNVGGQEAGLRVGVEGMDRI